MVLPNDSTLHLRKYHMDTEELEELQPELLLELQEDAAAAELQPLTSALPKVQHARQVIEDKPCLAYQSCLLTLANARIEAICAECSSPHEVSPSYVGTAIVLIWVWFSPDLGKVNSLWPTVIHVHQREDCVFIGLHDGLFFIHWSQHLNQWWCVKILKSLKFIFIWYQQWIIFVLKEVACF